jgi:hypothetical protein
MVDKETDILDHSRKYFRTFTSGLGAIVSPKNRTFYILEHKTNSDKHQQGEKQEIIVEHIELGRDPRCEVCFEKSWPTVSRRHAAIIRENDRWIIQNLSKTNPTLVNNKAVTNRQILNSGDEIQLSYEGPILIFSIPVNPFVNSVRFTDRLQRFGYELLKPYKSIIIALSCILILSIIIGGYFIHREYKKNKEQKQQITFQRLQIDSLNDKRIDSEKRFEDSLKSFKAKNKILEHQNQQIEKRQKEIEKELIKLQQSKTPKESDSDNKDIAGLIPNICFIYLDKIEVDGKPVKENYKKWNGAGFLLLDGRFITARHNIEPWYCITGHPSDDVFLTRLNNYASNEVSVVGFYSIIQNDGSLTTIQSDLFIKSGFDTILLRSDEYGNKVKNNILIRNGLKDWAATARTETAGLTTTVTDVALLKISQQGFLFDNNQSTSLNAATQLHILGFSQDLGLKVKPDRLEPIYGNCFVAVSYLKYGFINVNNVIYEGNTGGPVLFENKDGKYVVVGILLSVMNNQSNILPIYIVK